MLSQILDNPTRLKILMELEKGDASRSEIVIRNGLSQSAVYLAAKWLLDNKIIKTTGLDLNELAQVLHSDLKIITVKNVIRIEKK